MPRAVVVPCGGRQRGNGRKVHMCWDISATGEAMPAGSTGCMLKKESSREGGRAGRGRSDKEPWRLEGKA